MSAAQHLSLTACGIFFITGLLTGAWKYYWIANTEEAEAPYYVSIAHRTSLMYTFAAMVIYLFASLSKWSDGVNFVAALLPLVFFALSIASYILHGILRDTDNQFRKPHRLGEGTVPALPITIFMLAMVVAEVGGFSVLFLGYLLNT